MKFVLRLLAACVTLLLPQIALAQTTERTIARLFWQDMSDQSLRWGDLKQAGTNWKLDGSKVPGFPSLDSEKQMLVQMQESAELLLTGVHDTEDGKYQSGWVAMESGVTRQAHGDHFHWQYASPPSVRRAQLDDQQGNPAHVYNYDGSFILANDKKDGLTFVTPAAIRKQTSEDPARFLSAGGGHITIAAVNNRVAYSTWIDRAGDNMGRVDVVGLASDLGPGYSFHLPTGGIHGATAAAGKVFFAPTDGICWVEADLKLSQSAASVKVHHLSLGVDAEGNPKRTGAFTTHRNLVLFTTGRGAQPELCMVDASSPKPVVHKLALATAEGTSVTSPVCMRTRTGEDLAFIFEESTSGQQTEKLHVISLDPNRDGNTSDAKLTRSMPVGPSLIEGHSGHHELSPVGRNLVALTNPGDGSLWVISTSDWQVMAQLSTGGNPSRLLAVGGN
jgi:hypothetical protein